MSCWGKQKNGINFFSKSPVEVVDAEKAKLAELEGQLATMNTQIEQLKAL